MLIRIPKPSYALSKLSPRASMDESLVAVFEALAERHGLGEVRAWHAAPISVNSANMIVETRVGKYVFKRHQLSEETVAHEHQVLAYLEQRNFDSPRVVLNADGCAWTNIGGVLYSVYEFIEGFNAANYIWSPSARSRLLRQAGRTLSAYHHAVQGLIPSHYKWDGYRPEEHRRWREADWFQRAVKSVHDAANKSRVDGLVETFVRARLDALARMLALQDVVEGDSRLSKLVIHGDFAPWNLLLRSNQSPVVLDFNAARLDLKIYDIMFATFWFAWRKHGFDAQRALAFQAGYSESGLVGETDVTLASAVFRWIMSRAVVERLRYHYEDGVSIGNPSSLERFYQMCMFAEQHPERLTQGLKHVVQAIR